MSLDKQYRCHCLSCQRVFIVIGDPSVVVCPGCRRKFGEQERYHDYDYRYYEYRKQKYKNKYKKQDKLSDIYFEGTAEYCIVPWLRNPQQQQIIPDKKFHEWYEDMKQRIKNE